MAESGAVQKAGPDQAVVGMEDRRRSGLPNVDWPPGSTAGRSPRWPRPRGCGRPDRPNAGTTPRGRSGPGRTKTGRACGRRRPSRGPGRVPCRSSRPRPSSHGRGPAADCRARSATRRSPPGRTAATRRMSASGWALRSRAVGCSTYWILSNALGDSVRSRSNRSRTCSGRSQRSLKSSENRQPADPRRWAGLLGDPVDVEHPLGVPVRVVAAELDLEVGQAVVVDPVGQGLRAGRRRSAGRRRRPTAGPSPRPGDRAGTSAGASG